MPRAILIAGNAQRFQDDIRDLNDYLVRVAKIGPKNIKWLRTAYLDDTRMEHVIEQAVLQRTKEALLIAYCGHGNEVGWGLDDVRTYGYGQLAWMFEKARRPILLLNDTCHAMGAVPRFADKVSQKRFSLIGACREDKTTTGGLMRVARDHWRQAAPHPYGEEHRWGARLDHHFYPPSASAVAA